MTDVRRVSADVTSRFTVRIGIERVKAVSVVVVWSANLSMKALCFNTEGERCRRLKGEGVEGHSNGVAADAARFFTPTKISLLHQPTSLILSLTSVVGKPLLFLCLGTFLKE